MSVRSFRSLFMTGGVAAAALSCYLVSLRVAAERAALNEVETEIVLAQRDIRLLQTEIGTRGRLAQLERWNVRVLQLSAPGADQFLPDTFQLASLMTPEQKPAMEAPVVYASAPAPEEQSVLRGGEAPTEAAKATSELMHHASLKTLPARQSRVGAVAEKADQVEKPRIEAPAKKKSDASTAESDAPARKKPGPITVRADSPAKKTPTAVKDSPRPAKTERADTKVAQADPLAPLPHSKARKLTSSATAKGTGKTK